MSKMGNYVFEMQEAASYLTRDEFAERYGESFVTVWESVNSEYDYEPYIEGDYV